MLRAAEISILMKIKIGYDIEFELAGPTPMILMLYVHPSRHPLEGQRLQRSSRRRPFI